MLQKQTSKLMEKEIRPVVTRDGGGGRGECAKVVQRCKLPVIRQVGTRAVMCSMTNRMSAAVCYI